MHLHAHLVLISHADVLETNESPPENPAHLCYSRAILTGTAADRLFDVIRTDTVLK
jgi:hypothetical protein